VAREGDGDAVIDGPYDGANAQPTRNWPLANKAMAVALAEKGYPYPFVFANGGTHNQRFAGPSSPGP
jgi:hypothetical protein